MKGKALRKHRHQKDKQCHPTFRMSDLAPGYTGRGTGCPVTEASARNSFTIHVVGAQIPVS